MARQWTVNAIINAVALEVGLLEDADPAASSDNNFVQLKGLLNIAGAELVELHAWQVLKKEASIDTDADPSGLYTLPTDYSYMIDQTHWERTNKNPLGGPLSSQQWTYLEGTQLAGTTIYANFRLIENKVEIYPQPVPAGLDINYEYISRNWLESASDSGTYIDSITDGANIVRYEPVLAIKYLKAKFLESKGFNADSARLEFENMFNSRTGKDTGGKKLSVGRRGAGVAYIQPMRNVSDTGFGG